MAKTALIVSGSGDLPSTLAGIVGEEWTLSVCRTSAEAVKHIAPESSAPWDLLVVDYDAAGLDGLSLLRIIQDRLGDLPPTVLCADKPLDEVNLTRAEKFDLLDILMKPVNQGALEKAIAPLLWVSSGTVLNLVEFLGMALRKNLAGTYRIEAPSLTFDLDVRCGQLLEVRSILFLERWRAAVQALGMPAPPAGAEGVDRPDAAEESLPATSELIGAKTQAAMGLLAAVPTSQSVVVRRVGGSASATRLPLPLLGCILALLEHSPDELFAPLRSGELSVVATGALPRNLALSPQHGYLLSLCSAPISVLEILRSGVLPEGQALRATYLLLLLGALTLRPYSPDPFCMASLSSRLEGEERRVRLQREGIRNLAESLRAVGKSPYEILGVPSGVAYSVALENFENLRRQLGPQSIHPRVLKEMEAEVNLIQAKLSEAFLLIQAHWLQDRQKRIQAEVRGVEVGQIRRAGAALTEQQQISQNRLEEADRLYRRALEYMQEEEYHQAAQYVKLALFYNPLSPVYHFLQGRLLALMQSPRAKHMAEKALLRAIELDSFSVEYKVEICRLYLGLGLTTRCRVQIEKIQALDPKCPELAELKKAVREREKS